MDELQLQVISRLRSLTRENPTGFFYVVAVSGGLDSMCLLNIMSLFANDRIVVGHFNHQLRGNESDEDERLVSHLCKKLGIRFKSAPYTGGKKSEEELRRARYDFLEKVRAEEGADFILTAHHADDDTETFFQRLIRGTGLRGLAGIRARNGRVLRPLLSVTRRELEKYACENVVMYREDHTNSDLSYFRNRIRHLVLPGLRFLDDGISEKMRDTLQSLKEDLFELDSLTVAKKSEWVTTPLWTRFPLESFSKETTYWQKRLLHHTILDLFPSESGISRERIETLLRGILSSKSQLSFSAQISYRASCGWGFLIRNGAFDLARSEIQPMEFEEKGFRFLTSGVTLRSVPPLNSSEEIRLWRKGDRLNGKKLSDLFLEFRIPAPERFVVPVIAKKNSDDVTWAYGLGCSAAGLKICDFDFTFGLKG